MTAGTTEVRRWTLGLATLTLILAGCGQGKGEGDAAAADSTDPDADAPSSLTLPVVGAEVRQGDLVLSVTTTGQVSSESAVTLKAEAQGIVLEVAARPGQHLTTGQLIARLDPRPFDMAVAEAEAAVAEAHLRLLDNTVPDSIVTGRAVTGERLRNAEVRSGLDAAKVRLARARYDRDKATITAPFEGVLDDLRLSPGLQLSAGQEIGKLVDLMNLRIDSAVL
ncbi:MAG: biotin/lipoyl-binding protein [Gemmatimonadota bacterium]